jgi:hypothetical protein
MPFRIKQFPPGTRGDAFERAVPLMWPGPVVGGVQQWVPMPAAQVTQLRATYPVIQSQFRRRRNDPEVLIDLSSERAWAMPDAAHPSTQRELSIEDSYPLPTGGLGPCLVFRFSSANTAEPVKTCEFDVQFSGPAVGPLTWAEGSWRIDMDVTRPVPAP